MLLEGLQVPYLINRLRQGYWENQKVLGISLCISFFTASAPSLPQPIAFDHQTESSRHMGINFDLGETLQVKSQLFEMSFQCQSKLDLHLALGYHKKHISRVVLGQAMTPGGICLAQYLGPTLNRCEGSMGFCSDCGEHTGPTHVLQVLHGLINPYKMHSLSQQRIPF